MVHGNLGQLGKKGAYEILERKVTKSANGLIEVEAAPKKEPKPKAEAKKEEVTK